MNRHTQYDYQRQLVLVFQAILIYLVSACQSNANQRVCEPSTQEGCLSNQHCSINEKGTPLCIERPTSPKLSGERCVSSQECEAESGCVNYQGQGRCMSFCSSEDQELGREQCQNRFGQTSQCELSILNRDEIGLCSRPCPLPTDLSSNAACFSGDHCAVPLGADYARCTMSGQIQAKQNCDLDQSCAKPLSCVPNGDVARCQMLSSANQNCEVGEIARLLQGARDSFTGKAYQSCWSDIALQNISLSGQYYRLDLNLNPKSQSIELCQSLSDAELAEELSFLNEQEALLKTDLLVEIKSILAEAQLNVSGFWLPLPEQNTSSCQRLDLTSESLEPTPCDLVLPILCAYQINTF